MKLNTESKANTGCSGNFKNLRTSANAGRVHIHKNPLKFQLQWNFAEKRVYKKYMI